MLSFQKENASKLICTGFLVTGLLSVRLSEWLSEADSQRMRRNVGGAICRKIDEGRDRILNFGFSAGSPSKNLIVWNVMLFTVLFSFPQSYSIPILSVVTLDLDFVLSTSFSISVDPGSLSTSRLSLRVSRYISIDAVDDWNVWPYCICRSNRDTMMYNLRSHKYWFFWTNLAKKYLVNLSAKRVKFLRKGLAW